MASTPTMRELAKRLKMSTATVSLALRSDPRVAAATRRKVQAAARQAGYHLNPALTEMMRHVRRSERAQYKETLAWLDLGEGPERFGPGGLDYLRLLFDGATRRAEQVGYSVEYFWLAEPGMTGKRMSGILSARGIRGLLIPPLPRSLGHVSMRWADFAAVALTYTLPRPHMHRVVPAHFANMQQMLRVISRRGYRRPGMLFAKNFDERAGNRFRAAFLFHQNSLPVRDRIPIHLCPTLKLDERCQAWLERYRPDVVITQGALRHLDSLVRPGPATVLLGYAKTDAGFAAMDENAERIGSTAVDQLIAQLNRNELGAPEFPQTVLVPGVWVPGKTLPVCRAANSES